MGGEDDDDDEGGGLSRDSGSLGFNSTSEDDPQVVDAEIVRQLAFIPYTSSSDDVSSAAALVPPPDGGVETCTAGDCTGDALYKS